jgi:hypothetical protein
MVLLDGTITAASGSGDVTFRGGTFMNSGGTCTAKGSAPCLVLTAAERVLAGGSPGGVASQLNGVGVATGFMLGSCSADCTKNDPESASGFMLSNAFVYGYQLPVHAKNIAHARITNFGSDATRNLKDNVRGFALVDGPTADINFVNGGAGKAGFGIQINVPDPETNFDKGCVNFVGFHVGSYEVDNGCLTTVGVQGLADFLLVANATRRVQMIGDQPGLDAVYEGPTAEAVTDTNGFNLNSGRSWWGGQENLGGSPPVVSTDQSCIIPVTACATLDDGSSASAGRVSIAEKQGTSGPTEIKLTFTPVWPGKRPACHASYEGTAAHPISADIPLFVESVDQDFVVFKATSALSVGDNISYVCLGFTK